jgi:hypothetical protein
MILVSAVLGFVEQISVAAEQEKGAGVGVRSEQRCFGYPLGPLDQIVVRGYRSADLCR